MAPVSRRWWALLLAAAAATSTGVVGVGGVGGGGSGSSAAGSALAASPGAPPPVRPPLRPPVLVCITPDGCATPAAAAGRAALVESVGRAVEGGAVDVVTLRDGGATTAMRTELGRLLASRIAGRARLVMGNSDVEAAVACGADGVQLTEGNHHRVAAARVALAAAGRRTAEPLVGCSVHSVEAALGAVSFGADFLQVGTMFPTNTHPGKVPEGPDLLRCVAEALGGGEAGGAGGEGGCGELTTEAGGRSPLLIGVGGVDEGNCAEVLGAGGDGVAVISAVCRADDPAAAAAGLARRMQDAWAAGQ